MGCNNSLPSVEEFIRKHDKDGCNLKDELVDAENTMNICIKEKMFSFSGDSFKIRNGDGTEILQVKGAVMSLRDRMVLRDLSGVVVAVCLAKVLSIEKSFYIYSPEPRVEGQGPSSETEDGKPLYSWAKVNLDMLSIPKSYTIYMATGHDEFDNGAYRGENIGVLSPKMTVRKNGKGCCLVDRAVFEFECNNCYGLTIAPGIDPALMICFTVITDELKEK